MKPRIIDSKMDERKFRQVNRRELLKLTPVIALGALAIPSLQESLLKKGLGFSDWASARLFCPEHLATTFADSDLTPFEKFPINGYNVDDPGVILENWTLTVSGAVQRPGEYTLAQIQALPRTRQNIRHVCVEGWDVIGRFGGVRLSAFLNLVGRTQRRGSSPSTAPTITTSLSTWRRRSIRSPCFATKCMTGRSRASTAHPCV